MRYGYMVQRANISATVKQTLHRMREGVELGMLAEAKERKHFTARSENRRYLNKLCGEVWERASLTWTESGVLLEQECQWGRRGAKSPL